MGADASARGQREVRALPKAHLHLHVTGAIRPDTLAELADRYGIPLPADADRRWWDEPGQANWSRFADRYEVARGVVRSRQDIRRVVVEATEDDAADGSRWLEIQLDPSLYAPRLGGLEETMEAVLEGAGEAAGATGIGVGVVVAGSWARPARDAEALARLAARYAGAGVVGFGLSYDERHGRVADFAEAFRIARAAGLLGVPHGGFFSGPAQVEECVRILGARRIGHGVTAARDAGVMELLATLGVALEVCPTSYEPFGVVRRLAEVPLRRLHEAGVPVAVGADAPLLFGRGLADQYTLAREAFGFSDIELAELAKCSIRASAAPEATRARLASDVDAWLAS